MISLGPLVRREPTIEIEVIEEDEAIELEGMFPGHFRQLVIFDKILTRVSVNNTFSETPVFTPFHVAVLSALLAVSALCVTLACFLCKKPRKQEM